jgi:hypothetical protein
MSRHYPSISFPWPQSKFNAQIEASTFHPKGIQEMDVIGLDQRSFVAQITWHGLHRVLPILRTGRDLDDRGPQERIPVTIEHNFFSGVSSVRIDVKSDNFTTRFFNVKTEGS